MRWASEARRLHELASHMTDRKLAAGFLQAARTSLSPRVVFGSVELTPCDRASTDGNSGKFAEAYNLVEQNHCRYSDIAMKQFASDPAEAERELRKSTDKADVILGLARMSDAAAKNCDAADALRLLETARQVSGKRDYCAGCVQRIAWAWTLRGQPSVVLAWARSLPIADGERGYALLGVAQALAHPRRK